MFNFFKKQEEEIKKLDEWKLKYPIGKEIKWLDTTMIVVKNIEHMFTYKDSMLIPYLKLHYKNNLGEICKIEFSQSQVEQLKL